MNIHASRGPACGPSALRWASSCCSSGFVMAWWIVALGVVIVVRVRAALGRATSRGSRVSRAETAEPEAPAGDGAAAVAEPELAAAHEAPSYTREKFLEATTLGLGAVIGALVTVPVLGFTVLPAVPQPGRGRPRPRAARALPRGRVEDRDVPDQPRGRRRLPDHASSSVTTALARRQEPAELHDPLQPLRRTSAARCSRTGRTPVTSRKKVGDVTMIADAAVELRLPVPRRPVRHRGQPHRRPARPRARPLPVLGRAPAPAARQPVLGLRGRGHRRTARIYKWNKAFPGVHVDGPQSWLYPIQPPS